MANMFFENLEKFKHLRTTGSYQNYKYIYKGNSTLILVYVSHNTNRSSD
jgi:hypothetical protein